MSKRKSYKKVCIRLVAALLLCAVAGGLFAKYIKQEDAIGSVRAQEFYFTSDLLDGGTHELAPGTETLTFTIGNHADKLRYSEMDITYVVTVETVDVDDAADGSDGADMDGGDSGAAGDGEGDTAAEPVAADDATDGGDGADTNGGDSDAAGDGDNGADTDDGSKQESVIVTYDSDANTLKAGTTSDATIRLSGLKDGKTYTVTATGTGGYHKTLTATIVVREETCVVYKSLDTSNSAYVLLTVWSEGYSGDITITAPSTLIPDNTDSAMREWVRTNSTDTNTSTVLSVYTYTDKTSFQSGNENGNGNYMSHVYRFFIDTSTDDNSADDSSTDDNSAGDNSADDNAAGTVTDAGYTVDSFTVTYTAAGESKVAGVKALN